jgi:signal transduction histidine kinase
VRRGRASSRNVTRTAVNPASVTAIAGNAIRHNVAGGRPWARVVTATEGGRACFTVANSGPVIPAAEVSRLFEPFQQRGGERTGTGHGLGLAIAAAVVSAHDATLTARARAEGGLEITVTFPV